MLDIIAITGPTAVGKTKLSIALAKQYNAEIINCDAMQIYEDMNIATAKIKEKEMENIPHHLLSEVPLTKDYTVFDYQKEGRKIIENIRKRHKNVIIVGGTGLYLKALLYDYKFAPNKINDECTDKTNEELFAYINSHIENNTININNRQRLIRMYNKIINGEDLTSNGNILLYKAIIIGLTTKRKTLYDKINQRVDNMIKEGLIDEARKLYDKNKESKALNKAIGYKELFKYFNNEITKDEATNLIKKNSRHYAKRQYTFFNHQLNIKWFNTDYDDFTKTINDVTSYIDSEIDKTQ